MPRIIHPIAGLLAILTIITFWLSTAISELFASTSAIVAVKTTIPWGFLLLVPALVATSGSGLFLSKGERQGRVGAKLKRMPFIAINGVLVLIPSALFLASKAKSGELDSTFYMVQTLELIAGAVNIILLGLNMRDGLALTQWKWKSFLRPAATSVARLSGKEKVACETVAFHISKPVGFNFVAGQAVYVTLPEMKKTDTKGKSRIFSIASAPQDTELEITTRQNDTSFKCYLLAANAGTPILLEGPYGSLVLHDDVNIPAVFLAGGIGVTPFRSMILDATNRRLQHPLFLFYSNRKPEDAAYLDELRELEQKNPRFKLITVFTGNDDSPLDGVTERSHITVDMVAKYVGDLAVPIFYVSGPPKMVSAMEVLLARADVSYKNMRIEKFTGY